jgi:hypothetical protein
LVKDFLKGLCWVAAQIYLAHAKTLTDKMIDCLYGGIVKAVCVHAISIQSIKQKTVSDDDTVSCCTNYEFNFIYAGAQKKNPPRSARLTKGRVMKGPTRQGQII